MKACPKCEGALEERTRAKKSLISSKNISKNPLTLLTKREIKVLEWVKKGKTSWEISEILSISKRTVDFHINNVRVKFGASNRSHAIAIAIENGLNDNYILLTKISKKPNLL